eukprot:4807075-Pleurochrysis_carterae.AAC.1
MPLYFGLKACPHLSPPLHDGRWCGGGSDKKIAQRAANTHQPSQAGDDVAGVNRQVAICDPVPVRSRHAIVSYIAYHRFMPVKYALESRTMSEQGSLWCLSPASKARQASNLASKACSAPASKARTAELWPGPPFNLSDSVTHSRLRLLYCLYHNVMRAYTFIFSQLY